MGFKISDIVHPVARYFVVVVVASPQMILMHCSHDVRPDEKHHVVQRGTHHQCKPSSRSSMLSAAVAETLNKVLNFAAGIVLSVYDDNDPQRREKKRQNNITLPSGIIPTLEAKSAENTPCLRVLGTNTQAKRREFTRGQRYTCC